MMPLLGSAATAQATDKFITVASTTSTQNSGLFRHILPLFKEETGIEVRVVAVGTGQAIRLAKRGDADVLFVHHKPSEEKFVAEGYGVKRFEVMYNDFVIVGPKKDPAKIKDMNDASKALTKIALSAKKGKKDVAFASRGDDSGTNKKELSLWKQAGQNVKKVSGRWYRETGAGMGATLNTAAGMGAYTLTDRATWIAFKNKRDLVIHVEGDPRLFNQYGVILVNPKKFPHVKRKLGQTFIDWLISKAGQAAIGGYTRRGKQLFFPNARKEKMTSLEGPLEEPGVPRG
ncbi:MAG: substrate-binding domain-containing protein [Rhodospirillales bacterium]